jgi:hypothetical protein
MQAAKGVRLRHLATLGIAAALAALGSGAAQGSNSLWTQGDAEAMLNNYPPGKNIFERLGPENDIRPVDIRPFQDFYGSLVYCPQDWHVAAFLIEDVEFVAPTAGVVHTTTDVHAFLTGLEVAFVLDGAPLAVERKPIKPYLTPFAPEFFLEYLTGLYGPDVVLGNFWAFQSGRILPPGALSVGQHTLRVVTTDTGSSTVLFDGSVTFTVSPADSPACAV